MKTTSGHYTTLERHRTTNRNCNRIGVACLYVAVCDAGVHAMKYDKLQQRRLEEAQRTVLVLHPTRSSPVIELCQRYGHVRNAISFQHNVKV